MRTVGDPMPSSFSNASIMDKIADIRPKTTSIRKSTFYELGAPKAAIFVSYSNKPPSKLVMNCRKHRENHKDLYS